VQRQTTGQLFCPRTYNKDFKLRVLSINMKKKVTKAILKKREKRQAKREFREAWLKARCECLKRDNHECQICHHKFDKTKPGGTAVHHIIPRQYKDLFLDLDNLITLCSSCHRWSKNSPHQNALWFTEWLKKNKPDQYAHLCRVLDEFLV
jgi:5-methylcytosine-specific restriction endonuclease McrA